MKSLKLLLLFLLFIPVASIKAQTKLPDQKEIISLLCKKWQAYQMVSGERKMNIPPGGDYTLFNSDYTSEQKQDSHVKKSTWRYVESDKKIVFASGDEYILKEISAAKLVLSFSMQGRAVDLVLKPFVQ